MPPGIFDETKATERISDIVDAMSRYKDAEMRIPQAWAEELVDRIKDEEIAAAKAKWFGANSSPSGPPAV